METFRLAEQSRAVRHMFVRDLTLTASIGVHAHEQVTPQRIRINLDLAIADNGVEKLSHGSVGHDDLARVVDYEAIVVQVRELVRAGHVQLVETLAERLAEACLQDRRVTEVKIRVEKLDVFADAASVGIEIERRRC